MTPLTILIYGDSGVGKTPVALTCPKPALVLDVEGGSVFVPGKRVTWNPRTEAPPEAGDWEFCVVDVPDYATVKAATDYLRAGTHPFRSVVLDPVNELQDKCHRAIIASGRGDRASEQTWGFLLTDMKDTLRDIRDATMHPDNPVECVVFVTHVAFKDGKYRPMVQGQLLHALPRMVRVVGYLYAENGEDGEPSASPEDRRLLIAPSGEFVAKDSTSVRVDGGITGLYGTSVIPGPIDIGQMTALLNDGGS